LKTREQALRDLGRVVAASHAITSKLTPLEAAQRAWHPGGPRIEELAQRIAENRAARVAPPTD
jgi:hypothetical protein